MDKGFFVHLYIPTLVDGHTAVSCAEVDANDWSIYDDLTCD